MGELPVDSDESSAVNLENQGKEIETLQQEQLKSGDSWYLIDSHWFSAFKKYVTNDGFGAQVARKHDLSTPGPVDNSGLFVDESYVEVKDHLMENVNYQLVPKKAWDLLVTWYGKVDDQPPIERKVICEGLFQQTSIEIYPIKLKLCCYDNKSNIFVRAVSKVMKISELESMMRNLFEIPENRLTRLWNAYIAESYEHLKDKQKTIVDYSLQRNQLVVIEKQNENDEWLHESSKSTAGSSFKSSGSSFLSFGNGNNSYKLRSSNSGSLMNGRVCTPGLCGLSNLGNTCFMNSSLQCLSNVPALSHYFKSNKYKEELNRTNPIGMGGKLAKAYAHLIQSMWSGEHSSVAPREFKMSVGQFAPRFSGYQQQDGQELLSFLIDGLHEDLNRISKKPYIEMKDANGRPDDEVAEESWQNHRKRNNSIIIDVLHGLFRSTVDCPDCPQISVTFDPFCFLSLPLPIKRDRTVECSFIPVDSTCDVMKYKVSVSKSGAILDLCKALSELNDVPVSQMTATDVYNSRFHKIFKPTDGVRGIYEKDFISVFESPKGARMLPVYIRHASSTGGRHLFGQPSLIPISPETTRYEELYKSVLRSLLRYISSEEMDEKIDHYLNGGDQSEEVKEDESYKEDDPKVSVQNLFEMKLVNSYGTQEYKQIVNDGNPIKIADGAYLTADWSKESYAACFRGQWQNVEMDHSSMSSDNKHSTCVKLRDCMELFTAAEKLDELEAWYCSKCGKLQQALKKLDLWMLPPVLIINLKRFSYTRFYRDKLDTFVSFPTRDLDLTEFVVNPQKDQWKKEHRCYNLIAVSNHFGGLGGGHYTAYAKNYIDGQWHYFDDSSVSLASEDQVVTKAAYMLVYQRQDLDEWMRKNPEKPFPYLEPIFSPRAMETNGSGPFRFENNNSNANVTSAGDEDVVNNNIVDDVMDIS